MSKSIEVMHDPILTNKELIEKLMSSLGQFSDLVRFFSLNPKDLNGTVKLMDYGRKKAIFLNFRQQEVFE
jgi:hypothetical protein